MTCKKTRSKKVNFAKDPNYAKTLKELRQRTDQRVEQLGGPLANPSGFFKSTVPHPKSSALVGARADTEGFATIFDGRTLRNWSGDRKLWSVEDGAITGRTDGTLKLNQFLTWKNSTIRNFDLRLKVKISKGGNSGIQYRSTMRPEIGLHVVSGYQCDIAAKPIEINGMFYEERGRGILGRTGERVVVDKNGKPWVIKKNPAEEFPADQWHDFRILVRGNHHQHWINDQLTADAIDFDKKSRSLEGVLGLQVHTGAPMTVQFKDIKIKHLPDNLPLKSPNDHPIPK